MVVVETNKTPKRNLLKFKQKDPPPIKIRLWNNSQVMLKPCSLKRKRCYPDVIGSPRKISYKRFDVKVTDPIYGRLEMQRSSNDTSGQKVERISTIQNTCYRRMIGSYGLSNDDGQHNHHSGRHSLHGGNHPTMTKRRQWNYIHSNSWMKAIFLLAILMQGSVVQAQFELPRLLQSVPAPSSDPSQRPSLRPTRKPTHSPTITPTTQPSKHPSASPSIKASAQPSVKPSQEPSRELSQGPSAKPSLRPTANPSNRPSRFPSLNPTVEKSSQPSLSQNPSVSRSLSPTSNPTGQPSTSPSLVPTIRPTVSAAPSFHPSLSERPSMKPSQQPTLIKSSMPSQAPTLSPSLEPTTSQKPTTKPSDEPSMAPSISNAPSERPSSRPSSYPTSYPSIKPSDKPSNSPSISVHPTQSPTISSIPTSSPSLAPSSEPTNVEVSTAKATFWQEFNATIQLNGTKLNTTQVGLFERLIEGYTSFFSNKTKITTTCTLEDNFAVPQIKRLTLRYIVQFESLHSNVTSYEVLLEHYINKNLSKMENDLRSIGIPVSKATTVYRLEQTVPPTMKPSPLRSVSPSIFPTTFPSRGPSDQPSLYPTLDPTQNPTTEPSAPPSIYLSSSPSMYPTSHPSDMPSLSPSKIITASPTTNPTSSPTMNITPSTRIIATVSAAIGGMAVLIVAGLCFRRRCNKPDYNENMMVVTADGDENARPSRTTGVLGGGLRSPFRNRNLSQPYQNTTPNNQRIDNLGVPMAQSAVSMISHESIISSGSSVDGASENDFDDIQVLDDEFEKYKDLNLEKMRSKLEGIVTNFDGMMCQALTMALMEEEDDMSESESLVVGEKDSIQIEVDLLCEMNDWLKRTEGASIDERRDFMQESLNKMVANVRHGIISHEDATRAIHGSAALLGLQLAADIPETTLIVTGMRKSVTREDVEEAFKKFGEIESAAISSNRRGFGFVRFTSKKYAQRALERERIGEIVVQDVAVSVRLLKANMPEIEVRRVYSNERRSR